MKTAILTAAVFLGTAVIAEAGELKVIDGEGLTRLLREVQRPVQLTVKVDRADRAPDRIELASVYGFSPVVPAARKGDLFEFSDVPEGVWEIRGLPEEVSVVRVSVSNPE